MRHIHKPGKNNHVIVTLHGTGGSATDLFQIAQFIDQEASLIGFQGEVREMGMARYFARHADGSFDLRSLAEATYDLLASLQEVINQYDYQNHKITLIGYSNGANLAINLLKEFENVPLNHAVLYHPSAGRIDVDFKKQENLKVLLTSGANDPYITESDFNSLKQQMVDQQIDVQSIHHEYGHQLTNQEIVDSKAFVSQYV